MPLSAHIIPVDVQSLGLALRFGVAVALAVGTLGMDDAGRFRGMTRPGRAWVDASGVEETSSDLSSFVVLRINLPAENHIASRPHAQWAGGNST